MKFALAVTGALAAAAVSPHEDDAVMLSVSAISNSLKLAAQESSDSALSAASKSKDPRRAAELIQEYAVNTLASGQGIDADTREKLIAIRDILTNETYIALEQAHRHDQDLLNKHAQAINECGYKHILHLPRH
jgi:parvulin-like peptidyl-prolyl isomerase